MINKLMKDFINWIQTQIGRDGEYNINFKL